MVRADQTYGQSAESGQPDWDHFSTALTEAAVSAGLGTQLVEEFVQHMTAIDTAPI